MEGDLLEDNIDELDIRKQNIMATILAGICANKEFSLAMNEQWTENERFNLKEKMILFSTELASDLADVVMEKTAPNDLR